MNSAMINADEVGSKIAVVLLSYNHANLITSTLETILKQTVSGYEVIVSDDCSSDGTWEIIQKLAVMHSEIKAIQPPSNLGMAGNANFALTVATRPYIALLHHDDIYREDLLEKWCSVLESNPQVGFVFNQYGIHGSTQFSGEVLPTGYIDGTTFLQDFLLRHWGCPVRGTAMIRLSAWQTVGGVREQFGMLADVDLWMRLAKRFMVGYVAESIIEIRQDRPEYYSEMYSYQVWSWKRKRILSEIHIANNREFYDLQSLSGQLNWFKFRVRLNGETAKWIVYALIRRKWNMIYSVMDSQTKCDMFWLKALRRVAFSAVVRFRGQPTK